MAPLPFITIPTRVVMEATDIRDLSARRQSEATWTGLDLTQVVETLGYSTPGDGGGWRYRALTAQPSHSAGFQSRDGTWWEPIPIAAGVQAEAFGAIGDGSTDCTDALDDAVDYCHTTGVGTLLFGDGTFVCESQFALTAGSGNRLRLSLRGQGQDRTTLSLEATGSVSGYDTAGFGMLIDGWSDSTISHMTIDGTAATSTLCLQCQNAASTYNTFGPNLEIRGGDETSDRETTTNHAFRIIGNQSGDDAGYSVLYNSFEGVRFTTAYKLVDHVIGDGATATKFPNAIQYRNCRFDRYIIGVDLDDTDENSIEGFFNTGSGVASIGLGSSNFSHCIVIAGGSLNRVFAGMEPGSNSKPYSISGGSSSNVLLIASNCSDAGDYTATAFDNLILDRIDVTRLDRINNVDTDTSDVADVNFFGTGSNSHPGTGFQRVNIWARSANTKHMAIGYTGSTTAEIEIPSGDTLELDAGTGTITLNGDTNRIEGSTVKMTAIPTYADDSAAGSGGLAANDVYKTSTGELRIKT